MNEYRTHYAGKITNDDINKIVKISGWVENIRDHGGIIFVDIRDQFGVVQTVSNDDHLYDGITKESVVSIEGIVRKRSEDDYNPKILSGEVEILANKINVLSKSLNVLPFEIITSKNVSEDVRLKYRYLDLRNPKVKENILFRNKVISYLREKMNALEFTEIQTPILTASSPEGARDFIVPSRKYHGKFYALPQAPQQFKQLLMVAGFDKYFQIAPCFRDEDARSDRIYGEFYQLDLEMSFATEEDVYKIGEEIFYDTFKKFTDKEVSPYPFKRISYKDSMLKYGTDKPDLRNPLEIIDLTEEFMETEFKPFRGVTVRGIKVDCIADKSNSWFNSLVDYAKSIGMPGIGYITVENDMSFKGPIDKFLTDFDRENLIKKASLKKGSVLFFIAHRTDAVRLAGLIRQELGSRLGLIDKNKFEFCIINDFNMYEWNEEEERYDFTHNPFSMPKGGLESLNNLDPDCIVANQFDFVCNGIEMASGAVRNHDIEIMKKAFSIAGYSEDDLKERFKGLYTAFQYGAPPHAGMAPGIDRMLMLMLDENNIRETIAFPMSSNGSDLMMGAPSDVSEHQLREAHIKIR